MKKTTFQLLDKTLDLDRVEGKYSAFAKVPYALNLRTSKRVAKDGYGTVTVDGITVSRGAVYDMNVMVSMHCLLVPVGEVAREYGREYTLKLTGFTAEDGTAFRDQSFTFKTLPRPQKDPAYAAHDEVAMQAAREGIILLRNRSRVLPLAEDSVLNCFGAAQYMYRSSSTGASLINPRWQNNFHQAIQEHSRFRINEEISALYRGLKDVVPGDDVLTAAKERSDTAVIVLSRTSGEFLDNKPIKGGYYLSDGEEAMIAKVSAAFPHTVAVINTGYPIEMTWADRYSIDAILYTGFAGMSGADALMEILDGRTNPSGKLPDTWAYDYYDHPSAHNFINFKEDDEVPGEKDRGVRLYYEEDIYVGYRYFDTFEKKAAFCFGHGLSYTTFDIRLGQPALQEGGTGRLTLPVRVTNTGDAAGREVVQVYVSAPAGRIEKPAHVLAAFEKTALLRPGETQDLTPETDAMNFASFDEESGSYVLEKGEYTVFCGNSLGNAHPAGSFTITEEKVLRRVKRINLPVENFHRMTQKDPTVQEDSKLVALSGRHAVAAPRPTYEPKAFAPDAAGGKITFDQLKDHPENIEAFVSQLSIRELCALNVCGGANWYMPWQDGSAGKTNAVKKYGIPKIEVSDGNTGVNINKRNIGLPCSTVMAATFNKALAFEAGRVIGEESAESGIAINLGPGMNLHRNILNGRHPEYYSEDPYLAGTMAGMHGKGLVSTGTGCTYKHLFCNNSDTSRKGSQSIVSERALRELYYRVFEVAWAVQVPTCVMTSYNGVNGIYPAENADVLQKLVRGEWGFEGMIMTDWGTYDTVDSVEMVKAGNGWLTEGSAKVQKTLRQAVKEGRLERRYLEQNVKYNLLTLLKVRT